MQVQWIKHLFIYLPTPRIEHYQPVWSAKNNNKKQQKQQQKQKNKKKTY